MIRTLERTQVVPASLEEVFAFFAEARNLERITPPLLRFRVLTPGPIEMRAGARIDYRLRLHGLPIRWRTLIERWEPGVMFVDRQLSGPYRLWVHTHTFAEHEHGTLVGDSVRYQLPLGPIGDAAHAVIVRRDLQKIFDFRRDAVLRLFGPGS